MPATPWPPRSIGLQALLDQLNTNENDYLLATKLTNPSGTGNWQTVTSANLAACGLQPPSTAPSANRIAGVSTNSSNSAMALPSDASRSYSLIGYEPPAQVGTAPSGCTMFGNLLGGRARFTVRGRVQRNGVVYATYDLVREVNIRPVSVPAPENNLGLVITGDPSKSKTGSPFHMVYDQNGDGLIGTSGSTITEPLGNVNCILCTSPSDLNTGGTSLGSVYPGPVPNFPTFPNLTTDPTYAPLLGVAEAPNLDKDNAGNPCPLSQQLSLQPSHFHRSVRGPGERLRVPRRIQCRDRLQTHRDQRLRHDQDPGQRAAGQAVRFRRLHRQRRK